jgi:putative peptidoglycan lipid II flippase
MARLYSVAHYALGDAKRPLRFALVRLVAVTTLGYLCAIVLPPRMGIAPQWGAAGLTASAGLAGWIEFALLRRSLNRRIGHTGLAASHAARLWIAGLAGAAIGWGVRLALPPLDPLVRGAAVLPVFGGGFLAAAMLLRISIPGLRGKT